MTKKIIVEVTGENVGQLYRRLLEIAERIAQGHVDGVMNDGPDGDYEYRIYELDK